MLTYEHLLPTGVRMPKTLPVPLSFSSVSWEDNPFVETASEELGYPMVVKETHGSYGQQVRLAESREDLVRMLGEISPVPALVQEYVAFSRGRDVRIEVVGSEAVAAMKRVSETDFRANLYSGGRASAYEPNAEEKKIAVSACRALGLTFGGVDLLFGEDGHPYLCEVNSNAHIRSLFLCTGVNSAEHILREIRFRLSAEGSF